MDADETRNARADERRERRWANYFEVGYNAYELVLHFGQFYTHNGEVQWHTQIVTHPAYAGELLKTLKASLEEHERAFPAGKGEQMPNEVTYKVSLQVKDGPKLELSDTLKVDAYDKVEFELRPNKHQRVDLQPTGTSAWVHFLLIQSKPDPKSDPTDVEKVWYTVNGGSKQVFLSNDHALLGKGVIELLGDAPKWLSFHNKRQTSVTITCLVGRDNVPANGQNGGGGGTTPGYPGGGGGGGGTTPGYPGGGGGGGEPTPGYPGGGGGGGTTPGDPGGGGGTTPGYPGGGGGGGTTPGYPGGGGGGTTPGYPGGGGGGGTTPGYPGGGGGGGTTPGYPGGGETTPPPSGSGGTQRR